MMHESQTAVLERGVRIDEELATEPFEVAWAGEARWFVQFLESAPHTEFMITVQVSPDGLSWIDHETPPRTVPASGLITVPVREFGHWLRLHIRRSGGDEAPLTRIYLAVKE